jgi:putative membrane protein
MKRNLNEEERRHLDRRTAEAEERTGAQIVLAVVERCDVYAELPWKAFALGSAVAGLAVVLLDLLQPGWSTFTAVLLAMTMTLGAGFACALAAVALPAFARLFLDRNRVEEETRQYAESLFLSREIFATRRRSGILLLVSLFERQVVMLPDSGLRERLSANILQSIIVPMTATLAAGRLSNALEQGLARLEEVLTSSAQASGGGNEIPDGIIEERGP